MVGWQIVNRKGFGKMWSWASWGIISGLPEGSEEDHKKPQSG